MYACIRIIYTSVLLLRYIHPVPSSYLCFVAVSASCSRRPESESMPESIRAWSASKSAESMTCPCAEPGPWTHQLQVSSVQNASLIPQYIGEYNPL